MSQYLTPYVSLGVTIGTERYAHVVDQTLSAYGLRILYQIGRRLRIEYRLPFGKVPNKPIWKLSGKNEKEYAQKKYGSHIANREGQNYSAGLHKPYVEAAEEQEERIIQAIAEKRG